MNGTLLLDNLVATTGGGRDATLDIVDHSCPQSEEMWTGVTYGLASLMIAEGMTEEGFKYVNTKACLGKGA